MKTGYKVVYRQETGHGSKEWVSAVMHIKSGNFYLKYAIGVPTVPIVDKSLIFVFKTLGEARLFSLTGGTMYDILECEYEPSELYYGSIPDVSTALGSGELMLFWREPKEWIRNYKYMTARVPVGTDYATVVIPTKLIV